MPNLLFILFILFPIESQGQEFNTNFIERTLRIDYIFSGNSEKQTIALDQLWIDQYYFIDAFSNLWNTHSINNRWIISV